MAAIYCFSSTGNSLCAAKELQNKLGGELYSMTNEPGVCNEDVIGFVFPVYFWDLPKIVERFIEKLEITNKNAYVFGVLTYGGTAYGAQGKLKKILKKKQVNLSYAVNMKCVKNYLLYYDNNDTPEFHQETQERLAKVIQQVEQKAVSKIEHYTVINSAAGLTFPANYSKMDRNFRTTDSCTGCGICAKICPVENIKIIDQKPVFLHHCEHCIGCIHGCPEQALEWKDKTVGRRRYCNPHIQKKELITYKTMR